jgi:hypothetical protein
MKKFTLSAVFVCAVCVAAAVAQTAPGGAGLGTQQSSPSSMGRTPQQQPGAAQPDQNAPMGQEQTNNTTKSERKLKGCVQSQGGQYVLETKKGKDVALTGQDVSAHAGHEVAVHGTWEKGGSMSQSSTGTASSSEKTFNVSSVDMISDTCGKAKSKSEMGTGANGTKPAGSGTGTTGSSGTGTQPPQ